MADELKEKYENLRRTTMALGLILLVVVALSVIAFYKGWLGAPGKIYFSPNNNEYYIRCADNPAICGNEGICEKITITSERVSYEDSVCLRK